MPEIQLRQFDSLADYETFMEQRNPCRVVKPKSAANAGATEKGQWLRSDLGELAECLWLTMRSDKNKGVDDDGLILEFAEALAKTALNSSNDEYQISSRYTNMETSVKGNISFLMGMMAAQVVARRIYRIPLLLHLTDLAENSDIIKNGSSDKGKRPDFFGLDSSMKPFLIEAKGTTRRPSSSTMHKAIDQLLAIKSVRNTCTQDIYSFNSTCATSKTAAGFGGRLHAVASGSDNDVLTFYDLDPVTTGGMILAVDLDAAVLRHYGGLLGEDGREIRISKDVARLVKGWRDTFESEEVLKRDDWTEPLASESSAELYLVGVHGEIMKVTQPARRALVEMRRRLDRAYKKSEQTWPAFVSSRGFEKAVLQALNETGGDMPKDSELRDAVTVGDRRDCVEDPLDVEGLFQYVDWRRVDISSRDEVVINHSVEELRLNNSDSLYSVIGGEVHCIEGDEAKQKRESWQRLSQESGVASGDEPSLFEAATKLAIMNGSDGIIV